MKRLMEDEYIHSKWEEWRQILKSENAGEECSQLLRRMELQEYDDEMEMLPEDMMETDRVEIVADQSEDIQARKKQKKNRSNGAQCRG